MKPDEKENKKELIRKSLNYSILDAIFYAVMVGFGESFFPAFAVFLKANNVQLGILGSLPQTLGSFAQFFHNKLTGYFRSRKKFVCSSVLLMALMYIPITLVYYTGRSKIFHLILFVSLYWILGMVINPAWTSWIGDLVAEGTRGAFFSRRNRLGGLASFMSIMAAGIILQFFSRSSDNKFTGFAIIFALALIARIFSFIFLTKKYEPEYEIRTKAPFSFLQYLKEARKRNHGLLILYLCSMNFCVFLSAPFFAPYMLKDLNLAYLNFTIINATIIISKYIFLPVWGNAADRFGTKKILSLAGFLIPVSPLLWIISDKFIYLIIIQVFAGFAWAGFDTGSFNFILDSTSSQKRSTCVAYYNVINGITILAGGLLGGLIVKYNSVFVTKYFLVFIISTVLRYLTSFIFIPKLKEVRQVENIAYPKLLLTLITTMPSLGLTLKPAVFEKDSDKTGAP